MTREQAIKWHRRMWNWIADNLKEGNYIADIKEQYIYDHKEELKLEGIDYDGVLHNCFLCHYDAEQKKPSIKCFHCPLDWGKSETCEGSGYDMGLYTRLVRTGKIENVKWAKEIAREIANLPEKGES